MSIKNILYIMPLNYSPESNSFCSRFQLMPSNTYNYVVMPSSKSEHLTVENAEIHTINHGNTLLTKTKTLFVMLFTCIKITQTNNIAWIVSYDPLTLGLIAVILKKICKAKLLIEINGHLLTAGFIKSRKVVKYFIYKYIIDYCLHNADKIRLLNKDLYLDFASALTSSNTFYMSDYVPTHLFNKCSDDDGYILFVGYPFHIKGVDILIKAFKIISKDFPNIKLKIIGHTSGEEHLEYLRLTDSCYQIEFLKPLLHHQVIKQFERCKFFVLPSRSEAMGRVLIEAMACGKALIGSNTGGIKELITHGINGFLFEVGDYETLAHYMRALLIDDKLRQQMGEEGYKICQDQYSSSKFVTNFSSHIDLN